MKEACFKNCTAGQGISITGGIDKDIPDSAFEDFKGDVVVSDLNNNSKIGRNAFTNCNGTISLPMEKVSSVEDYAFQNCVNLTGNEAMLSNLTVIGEYAFSGCTGLTALSLNSTLREIGTHAFDGCRGLRGDLLIPSGFRNISEAAFRQCGFDGELIMPVGLTSIGASAFAGTSFCNITLPSTLRTLGTSCFAGCNGISSITVPARVGGAFSASDDTEDGGGVFAECINLETVSLRQGISRIGKDTFNGCSSLNSVTIPDSVKSIGTNAFLGCSILSDVWYSGAQSEWQKISISSNNDPLIYSAIHYAAYSVSYDANGGSDEPAMQKEKIGQLMSLTLSMPIKEGWFFVGWAENADAVESKYLPGESITSENDIVLYAVWAQPDFVVPADLTSIKEEAFENCAFSFVVLSDCTVEIQKGAFLDCRNMKYIFIPADNAVIDNNAFDGINNLTIIGVSGSGTESYAEQKGYDFIPVQTEEGN